MTDKGDSDVYEKCALICDAEAALLDKEREAGHWALKDHRRIQSDATLYCAYLIRKEAEAVRKARDEAQRAGREGSGER